MILLLKLFILVCIIWLSALLAVLFSPFILFGNAKEILRSLDQIGNTVWFRGFGRESISSHAWRSKNKLVLYITEWAQPGHCKEANRHEQPVIDFINKET